MGFFSKAFRGKASGSSTPMKNKKRSGTGNGAVPAPPPKPHWDDAWTRKEVEPEEIHELLRGCTHELKSRALDMPFLLLPFRPASDPSAARTFIRNFFSIEKGSHLVGERLEQELVLMEPMVLSSVLKWCWSRLAGGVVTWDAYELFRIGEQDSDMARDAFATFIPLSVESDARTKIIFDFFDLIAAIAAHGKTNGMGGRKLSRLAGWWAFEQVDTGSGFDGGYRSWSSAADATSHLFFAYLRSLSPDSVRGINGISNLPLSLQTLVQDTRYPPEHPPYDTISKVVMVVESVSSTPFALLRRARNFHYRDDDEALQRFSDFEDPVEALTDECQRVLKSIASANQSDASTTKASTSLGDSSWSRFEDVGFGGLGSFNEDDEDDSALGRKRRAPQGPKAFASSATNDGGRPTTPSWADFLSSGFVEESNQPAPRPLILPPDKILPPIDLDPKRGKSPQSHMQASSRSDHEPGELASINAMELDDAFWWVWITSLAGEETAGRKAAFGRCALIETTIGTGTWFVIEEMVKGAAPEPEMGAYVAEKKSRFTFGRSRKVSRTKSMARSAAPPQLPAFTKQQQSLPGSKTSIGPDQHARIQAAAAALQQKQRQQGTDAPFNFSPQRGRQGETMSTKTNSVFTLQPVIMSEAAPAMKWANTYDKQAIRKAYLGNNFAGTGGSTADLAQGNATNGSITPQAAPMTPHAPKSAAKPDYGFPQPNGPQHEQRELPALPAVTPGENLAAPTEAPPPVPVPAAPLPVASEPRNQEVAEAAHVPLPATTPMEALENPALPPAEDGETLDRTRTATQEQPNGTSPASSPESKREGKKLKKQPGQGGLRSMFGGKKKGTTTPTPERASDSAAVAAARAAYTGPSVKANYNGQSSLGRRLSGIGRKKTPPVPVAKVPPMPEQHEPLPAPPAPLKDSNYDSQTSLSHVDTNEQRHADSEFRTFDQHGPVDQPAFVPEDSPRPSFVPESEVSRPSTTTTDIPRGPLYEPPIGRGQYEPSMSSEEPTSREGASIHNQPQQRWSQIRRDAAERSGKSEEPQQTANVEDGEDSGGEETIESRVARIKARVAELTGGIHPQEPVKA